MKSDLVRLENRSGKTQQLKEASFSARFKRRSLPRQGGMVS